jgi:hypothetical protein
VSLFQNARYYPSLRPRIRELTKGCSTFAGQINAFLNFRESAAHILLPVVQRAEWAFFTNGDDDVVQRVWARERGLSRRASLGDILKAQIEEHRADVFYNLDATGWDASFIKSLPGCVKHVIAWHAAPFRNVSFTAYDLVVNNMPSITCGNRRAGMPDSALLSGVRSGICALCCQAGSAHRCGIRRRLFAPSPAKGGNVGSRGKAGE